MKKRLIGLPRILRVLRERDSLSRLFQMSLSMQRMKAEYILGMFLPNRIFKQAGNINPL